MMMDLDLPGTVRKRKSSSIESFDLDYDDDESMDLGDDTKRCARQNHSEIEKRRRDKMNAYIVQLSKMLPMCNAMNRKLDKLTVLRMAVQHMKSLRGAATNYTEASHKPSFLSDDELKHLILEAADGFLFVVGCDRARILYVSESVQKVLHYSRNDLIGQSLFDYLHPRDINKVKEQFSSSDLSPRERLIDAKTLMPVKTELPQRPTHLCSGARRSFYCRMKCRSKNPPETNSSVPVKSEKDNDLDFSQRKRKSDRKSFTVIHCTGYLKSWPTSKININEQEDSDDSCNLNCLVAVGQIKTPNSNTQPLSHIASPRTDLDVRLQEYLCRHTIDGKFTFVDQATTVVLGYLPQELLGTSIYEYYHQDDIMKMAEIHRKVLKSKEKVDTGVYRFKCKAGSFLHVHSIYFSFTNPWTKEVEYVVSKTTVVPMQEVTSSGQRPESGEVLNVDNIEQNPEESEVQLPVQSRGSGSNSQVFIPGVREGIKPGAGRIGRQIADEVLEISKNNSPQTADSTNAEATSPEIQIKVQSLSHAQVLPIPSTSAGLPMAEINRDRGSPVINGLSVGRRNLRMPVQPLINDNRNSASLPMAEINQDQGSPLINGLSVGRRNLHVPMQPLINGLSVDTRNSGVMPRSGISSTQAPPPINGLTVPCRNPGQSSPSVPIATCSGVSVPTTHNGISVGYRPSTPRDGNLLETVLGEQAIDDNVLGSMSTDNDEAAMSIIMSLLEADAGLGGPFDFNDLPWPL